jgi:hypothetical protein
MLDHADIKSFVRSTLGCGCPEEVFQSIDCKHNIRLSNELALNSVITIGNRLLIYVTESISPGFTEKSLALLVSNGKNERDAKGLNRLRLVIVEDEPLDRQMLQSLFDGIIGKDDKIHLHIIDRKNTIF